MSTQSYAGDVSPQEAYTAVTTSPHESTDATARGVLVDVRTRAEWTFVGVPVLPEGDDPLYVEWSTWPEGAVNGQFLDQLRAAGVTEEVPVYFLCRSGGRSKAAAEAATAAGLGPAYNVIGGFEGAHDTDGHRTVGGWKNDGLPWRQG